MSESLLPQKIFFDQRYAQKREQLCQYIQLSSTRMFVASFDDATHQYVGFADYVIGEEVSWRKNSQALEKLIAHKPFQQAKHTILSIADALYTLVPISLFDETQKETYIEFNHKVDPDLALHTTFHTIESIETVVVYAIPRAIHFLLKAKLPYFKSVHFSMPLLEAILLEPKSSDVLYLHIQYKRFEIIYAPNNRLHYFNSFQYENAEDVLYYLLYVMEQLDLSKETIKLTILGELEKGAEVYELLYQYVKFVTMGQFAKGVQFSEVLSEIPSHYYFSVFNQHLCE